MDPQNPRLPDGTSNDREAINRLLAEGASQLLALARDLADRGEGNPTELPIVLKNGSKYVVLEGNRRFAALKLIHDPRLADDPSHRAAFERIAKKRGNRPPKSLYCAIASNREEADPWLTLRHTGANDGVGVRVWSAEQTARHRQRMRAPVDSGTLRSIAIADEITEAYQADESLIADIRKVRSEKLTNIGRLFSGVTLTRMQFELRQTTKDGPRTLWARHDANQLREYFSWAFKFLATNSVDAFKNDDRRGTLLNEHAELIPDAAASLPDSRRLADHPYSPSVTDSAELESDKHSKHSDVRADDPSSHDDASDDSDSRAEEPDATDNEPARDNAGPQGARRYDQRPERFLYSDVRLPNLSSTVQRLLREARQLPIEENYATSCVLARVILELAVSDPKVLAWSGKKESASLAQKIRACLFKLDPLLDQPNHRKRQDLVQANLETDGIGVVYLHQFMHNPTARPDPHLARRFSSAYTPLLNSINQAMQ